MDECCQTSPETDPLSLIGSGVLDALELIDLPAYVTDSDGNLRWANRAVTRLVGDRVGQPLFLLGRAHTRKDAKAVARGMVGGEAVTYAVTVIDSAGRPAQLRVHSAPLRGPDQRILGFLGLAVPEAAGQDEASERTGEDVALTPRQTEVLQLLGEGLSTEAIASRLGIAVETARNHIRAVLRELGVHSRLEAVIEGRERGLLDDWR